MADLVPAVAYSDLELWAVGWWKAKLDDLADAYPVCADFETDNKEPPEGEFPQKLLIAQDLGGPGDYFSAERVLMIVVLLGTAMSPKDANEVIGLVAGAAWQMPAPDAGESPRNPVAAVDEVAGPFKADEAQDRARRFVNVTLRVTPVAL